MVTLFEMRIKENSKKPGTKVSHETVFNQYNLVVYREAL